MKRLKLVLLIFMLFLYNNLFSATGCKIGNQIYTSQITGSNTTVVIVLVTYANYQNTPTLSTVSTECPRAGNVQPAQGLINLCVLNGSLLNGSGMVVTYDAITPPLGCSIDDYSWAFGSIASIFAFIMIRRTRKSQLKLS